MTFFDSFEKKFLFNLTRGLAMFLIFGLIVGIVVGAFIYSALIFDKTKTKVDASEVIAAIKPPVNVQEKNNATDSSPKPVDDPNLLPGIKLPFVLQKKFDTPDNIRTLRNILNSIPIENRQEFIDEMAAVVVEADKQNIPSYDAINKFIDLKKEIISAASNNKSEMMQYRLYFAGAVLSAVVLIALFSLILVLLAIERNTRQGIP